MKQVIQSYRTGKLQVLEVPAPTPRSGSVLVRTDYSLVSVGTEKMLLDLARKSLVGKALARPDLVRQVIAKAQSEGILEAWRQAMGRLNTPVPLGYSSTGVAIAVGSGVEGISVGDRVACAGSGYAGHTEIASIPVNLCVKIPDEVDSEEAAFVALGGIALEALRMAHISLGETTVVIGLGLLGQIAVQLLKAAGCHVIGMDIDAEKAKMALGHGAEIVCSDYSTLSDVCRQHTANQGADAALIFAATSSNEPMEQAAELCRERGHIVAAGLVGLEVPRKPFYDKELSLVVSRAWGPGLYDPNYAERGLDYPLGYARWTARRNMEEFLAQLAKGAVQVGYLITHRFPIERAVEAYELILKEEEPYIGVLITYPEEIKTGEPGSQVVRLRQSSQSPRAREKSIGIGLIGAGLFARGTLLPAIKGIKGCRLEAVVSSTGLSARYVGDRFSSRYCTSDYQQLLSDPEIDLVLIATRHGSHSQLVAEALKSGKHVFVEKPLALSIEQLQQVVSAVNACAEDSRPQPLLMVGFNRRFSPCARWLKERFAGVADPLAVHCTVNAGMVPPDHWIHDPDEGGGRIIGEVCHFVDLIQYLTGSMPVGIYGETLTSAGAKPSDNVLVTLKMDNGAVGSITYVAGGDKRFPRERIEVFGSGAAGVIENFKGASFTRQGHTQRLGRWGGVDRGHRGEVQALLTAIRSGQPSPVDFHEYISTTLATFAIEESLKHGKPVKISLVEETSP